MINFSNFAVILSILLLNSCTPKPNSGIITVTENGKVAERIAFDNVDGKKLKIYHLFFDELGQQADSIVYAQNGEPELWVVEGGKYTPAAFVDPSLKLVDCGLEELLKGPEVFFRNMHDVCQVATATSSNGDELKFKQDKANPNGKTKLEFKEIGMRFPNFSLEIQKHFYNQVLTQLTVTIEDDKIDSELYEFENGQLKRTYSYSSSQMTVEIEAIDINGKVLASLKEYTK